MVKRKQKDHRLNSLTALEVRNAPANAMLWDGGNLIIQKHKNDNARGKWIMRYQLSGKRQTMGLGAYPAVSLANARIAAQIARNDVMQGQCPKRAKVERERAAMVKHITFEACALSYMDNPKQILKGGGDNGRWLSPLNNHVFPSIGKLPIDHITVDDVINVLKPIWYDKHETAKKAANRIALTIEHAQLVHGIDCDVNAVKAAKRQLGHVEHIVKNIPHVKWQEVPALYTRLDVEKYGIAALITKFAILTAGSRYGEIRRLKWADYDKETQSVFIPAANNKRSYDRRLALSPPAVEVLNQAAKFERNQWIFPNSVGDNCAHDSVTNNLLKKWNIEGRGHGFRTSLKRWGISTKQDKTMTEMLLDHAIGNSTEASYSRISGPNAVANDDDMLEERRELWTLWAAYVCGE